MCKGMLGQKIGMTSIFASDGKLIPVTVVKLGPCQVVQVKSEKTDGYNALQLGFGDKAIEKLNKPDAGHLLKNNNNGFRTLREFSVENPEDYEPGQDIKLDMFSIGDLVNVSGISKGRGFAGTIKRHGFSRGPDTHGCRNHRKPGSIGCSAWPARVIKGKKMPGHFGVDRKTIKNLRIIDIRPEENIALIKGPVPGAKTGLLEIYKSAK